MTMPVFSLIGYVSGLGGVHTGCGRGPLVMQSSPYLSQANQTGLSYQWEMITSPESSMALPVEDAIAALCTRLAATVVRHVQSHARFCVIGGDHTSAIGTWSGAYHALKQKGDIGLIWIDAHMDSHTPETTESGRVHGMPLASLMGYGYPVLSQILEAVPKIKPDNICLIGVRSYERGEQALLERLKVKIYGIDEVKQRGFVSVFREAVHHVNQRTIGYGISLDLDSIDPSEAPGVDVPEPNGIQSADVIKGLLEVARDNRLIGTEIVEFNPERDTEGRTEKLIASLLTALAK